MLQVQSKRRPYRSLHATALVLIMVVLGAPIGCGTTNNGVSGEPLQGSPPAAHEPVETEPIEEQQPGAMRSQPEQPAPQSAEPGLFSREENPSARDDQAPSEAQTGNEKVASFAAAYMSMMQLQKQFERAVQESPGETQAIEQQANQQMEGILSRYGLTQQEYESIARQLQHDEELRNRVRDHLDVLTQERREVPPASN